MRSERRVNISARPRSMILFTTRIIRVFIALYVILEFYVLCRNDYWHRYLGGWVGAARQETKAAKHQ